MNPAVRGVVRAALSRGWSVFLVLDGWAGLMEGSLKRAEWTDVSQILQLGGTVLGTARSARFKTTEGRCEAAYQLASRSIDGLVCIGGDGSLTGASILRTEWPDHMKTLRAANRLRRREAVPSLDLIGLVGSIDNDLIGFTQTIGADSALQRIIFGIDCVLSTATSHGRTFVVEVMGRNSGYLALAAAVISGSDFVLIPERPVPHDSWKEQMTARISARRQIVGRTSIILLAEGAIDSLGNKITAEEVKQVVVERLQHDTRITTLGHVQRGGSPSAYDRYQGTVLGVAAVDELATEPRGTVSLVCGMVGYQTASKPLMQCVAETQAVGKSLAERQFEQAFQARGSAFSDFWELLVSVSGPKCVPRGVAMSQAVVVATVGAPAPGMNHCSRAVTRLLLHRGHRVFFSRDGFQGLIEGHLEEAQWSSVSKWARQGGSFLGTGRTFPSDKETMNRIQQCLHQNGIRGLIVIGGFEAYSGCHSIHQHMPYVNVAVIPATISRNVPASEISIGMDKASNNLATFCDNIKQSCMGYSKRIFVVESIGRSCGFQSLYGGIISGAEEVFLPESPLDMKDVADSVRLMQRRFATGSPFQIGLIINSEESSNLFSTSFLRRVHESELPPSVSAREAGLAGLQQGGDPSPMDRISSGRLALAAVDAFSKAFAEEGTSGTSIAVMCGLHGDERCYTDLNKFPLLVDMKTRRPLAQEWIEPLQRVFQQISIPTPEILDRLQKLGPQPVKAAKL